MEKIRIGVFGLSRGQNFVQQICALSDIYELTAICDWNPDRVENTYKICDRSVKGFGSFDEFLDSGLFEAVVLANYFSEHTPYAIRCLERGIAVISECTSASTLKECVELAEAVERTGSKYMIGENYPFTAAHLEMKRLYKEGYLGNALYAEGEYNHNECEDVLHSLTPHENHWRAWMPRTYYCTHALGPLMYMTETMPKSVCAHSVHSTELEKLDYFRHNYDAFGMMDIMMDNGAMFRATGCTALASPSRYRLIGENGSCESGGAIGGQVFTNFFYWKVPEGMAQQSTYTPDWPEHGDLAKAGSHGGGDFWTVYNFAQYIRGESKPFFDVYAGVAMSAVGILGWRSCLNGSATYKIPDFRSKSDRDAVRNDDLSPFPNDDGIGGTLPPAIGRMSNEEERAQKNLK